MLQHLVMTSLLLHSLLDVRCTLPHSQLNHCVLMDKKYCWILQYLVMTLPLLCSLPDVRQALVRLQLNWDKVSGRRSDGGKEKDAEESKEGK